MSTGNNLADRFGGTICLSKAALAEGLNANTIKTTNAVDFAIDGVLYQKAATDNVAVDAGAVQAVSTSCLYLISINASGTIKTSKGTEVTTPANSGEVFLKWPATPAGYVPIGGLKIKTDSDTTFTAGSTDLSTFQSAGGIFTFYDFMLLPSAPIDAA